MKSSLVDKKGVKKNSTDTLLNYATAVLAIISIVWISGVDGYFRTITQYEKRSNGQEWVRSGENYYTFNKVGDRVELDSIAWFKGGIDLDWGEMTVITKEQLWLGSKLRGEIILKRARSKFKGIKLDKIYPD